MLEGEGYDHYGVQPVTHVRDAVRLALGGLAHSAMRILMRKLMPNGGSTT